MIYVVYEINTGQAVSLGGSEPQGLRAGLAVYSMDVPYASLGAWQWDAAQRALVPFVAPPVMTMSKLTFASRWTLPEQVALDIAEQGHPDPAVRATIRVIQRTMDRATEVNVTDPRTVQGTDTLLDILVAAGAVTAQDRAVRREAILAPLSPGELAAQLAQGAA